MTNESATMLGSEVVGQPCPNCGAPVYTGARFCASCGHRLDRRAEERRVVTVLFADLVGFTTLAETRDPEQVKRLVDRCFSWLVGDIVRHGGQVDKIIGDAILALFGAPLAHEDDAERAVRAALGMQRTLADRSDELGDLVRMRVGVNTGEVLVGAMRAGGDYTAMGDVVNIASRLQGLAAPDQVLVGRATHDATRQAIHYVPRGMLEAKGREAPVEAWLAVEALAPPGTRPHGPAVPLVGRDAELGLLERAAVTALRNDRAGFILLLGEAGIGKTRLANELNARVVDDLGAWSLEGRCAPYGEVNVWWPLAEALRRATGVAIGDAAPEVRERMSAMVAEVTGMRADADDTGRLVAGLLRLLGVEGLPRADLTERAAGEIVGSLVQLLEQASARRPVVVRLSDLHWADDVVLDALGQLLAALAHRRVLFVAAARRDLLDRWTPPVGRFDTVVLNVEALDEHAAGELADSLAGDRALSPEVRATLIQRSGGNPFFLEELLRLLQDGGTRPAAPGAAGLEELPGTLRGLLTARLDQLPAEDRALVEDASVLGREGRVSWLLLMAGERGDEADIRAVLGRLSEGDMLTVHDGGWSFRSDLQREVAYHTLTKSERARRHATVALWIEDRFGADPSDLAVHQLAHHASAAALLARDLGPTEALPADIAQKAVRWLGEAGRRATGSRAFPRAVELYSQALDLAGDGSPAIRLELLLARAEAARELRDLAAARADVEAAGQLAADLSGSDKARVLLVQGGVTEGGGDYEGAVRCYDEARELFEAAGDLAGRAEALRARSSAQFFCGRYPEAERSARDALAAFRAIGHRHGEAWALQSMAWLAFVSGRNDDAARRLDEALAAFTELDDHAGRAWILGLLGFVRFAEGRIDEAEELQEVVLEGTRATGDRWGLAMMLLLGASVRLWTGRTEEAVVLATEALERCSELDDPFSTSRASWTLGRALVMVGRIDEGLAILRDVAAATEAEQGPDHLVSTVLLGATQVQLGDPDAALATLGVEGAVDGTELQVTGVASLDRECLVVAGLAALQAGLTEPARSWLERAAPPADPGGNHSAYATVAVALGELLAGRPTEALERARFVAGAPGERVFPGATYLDETTARIVVALASVRLGDGVGAAAAIDAARAVVDATGDRVSQAMVRLAGARVAAALGDGNAAEQFDEAHERLRSLGLTAAGWDRVFTAALADVSASA